MDTVQRRPRLGVFKFASCDGCQLSLLDCEDELLAVAGAAYGVLDGRDASFSFNPQLIQALDDGINGNDSPFRPHFPYMALAQSGQEHIHTNPSQQAGQQSIGNPADIGLNDANSAALSGATQAGNRLFMPFTQAAP